MNLRPLGARVIVEEERLEITPSGIIKPKVALEKEHKKIGKVVAIGEGYYEHGVKVPLSCKVGDRVMYPLGAGFPIDEEKHIYALIERDVIAIVE